MDRWLKYFLVTLCGLQCSTYSVVLWEWRPFGIHSSPLKKSRFQTLTLATHATGGGELEMICTRLICA